MNDISVMIKTNLKKQIKIFTAIESWYPTPVDVCHAHAPIEGCGLVVVSVFD